MHGGTLQPQENLGAAQARSHCPLFEGGPIIVFMGMTLPTHSNDTENDSMSIVNCWVLSGM